MGCIKFRERDSGVGIGVGVATFRCMRRMIERLPILSVFSPLVVEVWRY